jgi:hypothetical protein
MWTLSVAPESLSRADRRALGLTRRDIKVAMRCLEIDRMARHIAGRAESEPAEDSIFELMEAEGATYADSLSAWN